MKNRGMMDDTDMTFDTLIQIFNLRKKYFAN